MVVPCGLSLFDNLGRHPELRVFDPFRRLTGEGHWQDLLGRNDEDGGTDDGCRDWLLSAETAESLGRLRNQLDKHPALDRRPVSAETNTVLVAAATPHRWLDGTTTQVLLLASDTPKGVGAACAVAVALDPSEVSVEIPSPAPGEPGWLLKSHRLVGPPTASRLGPCTVVLIPGLRMTVAGRGAPGQLEHQLDRAIATIARVVATTLSGGMSRLCLVLTGGFKALIPYMTAVAPYFRCVDRVDEVVALATHDDTVPAEVVSVPLHSDRGHLVRHLGYLAADKRGGEDARRNLKGLALRYSAGGASPELTGVGLALNEIRLQLPAEAPG